MPESPKIGLELAVPFQGSGKFPQGSKTFFRFLRVKLLHGKARVHYEIVTHL